MSDYGAGSRLLHRLALGSSAVAEASFDLERALFGREALEAGGPHVFVAGLARSGTTVLMRALFESGEFCSLTYRDMPFVLAPGLWSRLASVSRRDRSAAERSHGDGVMVDFDSPEALEEVFWRVFHGDAYIRPDRLLPVEADRETLERFRAYVGLILRRYGKRRYLSKNNNNILRIPSLLRAFPDARVLVPFRDPAQQAYSLMKQHRRFRERDREDPFIARYMGWLVHHEFGADHRPFAWDGANRADPETFDGWLRAWIAAYAHLARIIEAHPRQVLPVGYEALCTNTAVTWERIARFAGVTTPAPEAFRAKTDPLPTDPDPSLLEEAGAVHARLGRLQPP